jgi:hypothetical protein
VDRPGAEPFDEGGHVLDVPLDGEVVAHPVPTRGLVVPQAGCDDPVVPSKRLHLRRPVALVQEGAVNEDHRGPGPILGEGHVVAVDVQ